MTLANWSVRPVVMRRRQVCRHRIEPSELSLVQQRRGDMALSVDEVARLAGVSAAAVMQIEEGAVPTGTLWSVRRTLRAEARALDTSVDLLYSAAYLRKVQYATQGYDAYWREEDRDSFWQGESSAERNQRRALLVDHTFEDRRIETVDTQAFFVLLHALLAAMPKTQRRTIILHYGLNGGARIALTEIAKREGLVEQTIHEHLTRGLLFLTDAINASHTIPPMWPNDLIFILEALA
jgi:transcriptional regulator with XRE-family HTH domain